MIKVSDWWRLFTQCLYNVISISPSSCPSGDLMGKKLVLLCYSLLFICHRCLAPTPPYDPYGGYPVPPVPMPTSTPVPAPSSYVAVQGAVIPSSGSVGMRIQYSKNPFGKRKDINHSVASPSANGAPPALTYQ